MARIYNLDGKTVIPVEEKTADSMRAFLGPRVRSSPHDLPEQERYLKEVRKFLSRYIDDTCTVVDDQPYRDTYRDLRYSVPVQQGKAEIDVTFYDNLGERVNACIDEESPLLDRLDEIRGQLNGKSGFILQGHYFQDGMDSVKFSPLWKGGEDYDVLPILNALCQGRRLSVADFCSEDKHYPLTLFESYEGYDEEIEGPMIGLVLARLKEVDLGFVRKAQHDLAEFYQFVRQNTVAINDIWILALGGTETQLLGPVEQAEAEGKITTPALQDYQALSDAFFHKAIERFERLQPPQNQRMKYLVTL